jgi:hypothetical protein
MGIRGQLVKFILITTLLNCCNQRKDEMQTARLPQELFATKVNLTSDKLESSKFISGANSIFLNDNLLIVSNPDSEYLFKIIQTEIDSVIGSFARIGEGPCEFQFPSSIQTISGTRGFLGLVNRKKFTFSLLSIDSILSWSQPCIYTTRNFNTAYQRLVLLNENDSLFVGIGLFPRRYALSKINGDTLFTFGEYPFREKFVSQRYEDLAMVFQGDIAVHPKEKKFVFATRASANIEIYEVKGDKPAFVKAYYFWPPDFNVERDNPNSFSANFTRDNKFGFLSTSVNEKYIYLLYSGKSGRTAYESSTILVFDWQGKPHIMYNLDREVNHIAVDPFNKEIYAYAEEDTPLLLKYKLPTE